MARQKYRNPLPDDNDEETVPHTEQEMKKENGPLPDAVYSPCGVGSGVGVGSGAGTGVG